MKRFLAYFSFLMWATIAYAFDIYHVEANGLHIEVYPEYNCASVSVSQGGVSYAGDYCIPESVMYDGKEYPVTSIRVFAFGGCRGVTSVLIPNTVKSIGESALSWTSISSIDIPSSVTYIGESAISACNSLTTVVIPDAVTFLGEDAFGGCQSLTSVSIGNSLEEISATAFYTCEKLSSVTLGNSIKKIGPNAFYYCHTLSEINFPASLVEIGQYAFMNCFGLKSVTLGNSFTTLGIDAFAFCKELESVILPASLADIGIAAFSRCEKLSSVTNLATNPQDITDKDVFYSCNLEQCILHVLPGCKSLYESAEGWKDFANIVEDADPTSIVTPFTEEAAENPVFSIYGNRVSDATAKGLQIRNGQVVLIR